MITQSIQALVEEQDASVRIRKLVRHDTETRCRGTDRVARATPHQKSEHRFTWGRAVSALPILLPQFSPLFLSGAVVETVRSWS